MRGLQRYSKEKESEVLSNPFARKAPGPALWVGVDKITNALNRVYDPQFKKTKAEQNEALKDYQEFLVKKLGKGADNFDVAKQRLVPVGEQMAENILKSGHL